MLVAIAIGFGIYALHSLAHRGKLEAKASTTERNMGGFGHASTPPASVRNYQPHKNE